MVLASLSAIKPTYILIAVLLLVTAAAGGYYLHTEAKISRLEKANVELSLATELQKETIGRLQKANTDIQKANAQIRIREGTLRSRVVALESKLRNVFRSDATKESIEKEVRQIETDRLRCFEIITGSQATEKDMSNSICSDLLTKPPVPKNK